MASGKSIEILGIDEEELLKTYKLSSLKPSKWEEVDPSTKNPQDVRGLSTPNSTKPSKGEDDPLGIMRGPILTDVVGDLRNTVSTTSKTFDPKAFLSTVHPNASFSDLKKGGARLRESLEQRSEALKILVESEFDCFVSVKVAHEAVYEQMKAGPLKPECDYGTADLKESLRSIVHLQIQFLTIHGECYLSVKFSGTSKADQVYTPLLENRKKAERLRSTLGVFERSKFFFNLPGTLIEAIEAEKYDAVLLAYTRGKNMLDSRPGLVLNLPAPSNPEQSAQQKRIFDKVWSDVEKVVNDFKLKLLTKLATWSDGSKPIEEIDKTIEIILELDPMSDPAWTFCENQHKSIMEKLVLIFKDASKKTRGVSDRGYARLFERNRTKNMMISDGVAKHAVGLRSVDPHIIYIAVQGACGILACCQWLSKWKIPARELKHNINAMGVCRQHHVPQTQTITSCFFLLRLIANYAKTRGPEDQYLANKWLKKSSYDIATYYLNSSYFPLFPTLPQSATFYLRKLLDHLTEWVHEFTNLGENSNCLKEFLDNARFKFLTTIGTYWVKDAKVFHLLEDWVRPERSEDESQPVGTTMYLKRMYNFQRYMMLNSYCLQDFRSWVTRRASIPASDTRKAQSAFLDGLYGFLDGLVHIAFTSAKGRLVQPDTTRTSSIELGFNSALMDEETIIKPEVVIDPDEEEIDIRLLLTISNLSNFTMVYIPRLFKQFSEAFSLDMTNDLETLMDVVEQLDTLLLGDYIKRKAEIISEIIQTGVLSGKVDWLTAPKPTGGLVGPIPSTQNGGEPLVKIVLSKLVEELAQQCLEAFGSVEKFGMGGMLQATLEIEFIHRTLSAFITPEADLSMQGIYQKITSAYQRSPAQGEKEGANNELQNELEALKRTLHLSRRTTALAFVCFKKPKSASSASPHEDITEPMIK
ncbi:hypothetical protein PSTT_15672, partial [Puccinia striiformis]